MAITDTQKVDYLWKKVGYGATKTDTTANKEGYNEAIPSPLQLRADKVMKDAAGIPNVMPASTEGVTSVYPTSAPAECTNDATASTNRTWKTNLTDWISPEFGSTYQAKVYIHTSGMAGNAASAGTQVFAAGSGNNDEWFFDYQAGVLNFIGTNLPNGVSFTGKSVYISGARYIGSFGVGVPVINQSLVLLFFSINLRNNLNLLVDGFLNTAASSTIIRSNIPCISSDIIPKPSWFII